MSIVLVLGKEEDKEAQAIFSTLRQKNIPTEFFNTEKYPHEYQICWDPTASDGVISLPTREFTFSDIKAVYWRSIEAVKAAQTDSPEQKEIITNDSTSMLRTLLEETNIKWVNSWKAVQFHRVKPRQLALAKRLGAKIPASIIGNHVQQITAFIEKHPNAIYKPVSGGAHTAMVSKEMLEKSRLEMVCKLSPVTIQAFIPGVNVRSYVIGTKVFSAEIHSDEVDFRSDAGIKTRPIILSADDQALARAITSAFGMQWTAIDWRRDESGELVFLEANPSPMFVNFEKATGYPIAESLVELLCD